MGVSTHKIGV